MTVQSHLINKQKKLEESGEIKILNDKQDPTHVPFTKGQEQNCLDFMMITPVLEKRTRKYKK